MTLSRPREPYGLRIRKLDGVSYRVIPNVITETIQRRFKPMMSINFFRDSYTEPIVYMKSETRETFPVPNVEH